MKRILVLTALAATLAIGAVAGPAAAGFGPTLTNLTVNPNVGRPGDAFTVSGGGCGRLPNNLDNQQAAGRFAPRLRNGQTGFSVAVAVAFPAPTATNTVPDVNGNWAVGFVVPPGTPPGVYQVSAVCMISRGGGKAGIPPEVFPYVSSTYTVPADPTTPAAPAPAVVSAPRFTG